LPSRCLSSPVHNGP